MAIVHRPHPMTGPWPYRLDPSVDPPMGEAPSLIDRQPVDGSLIYDDPDGALLYDQCERCTQQAEQPLYLDSEKLGKLWSEMVDVEHGSGVRDYYRTVTEAAACRRLYHLALLIERTHPRINPWTWPWTDRTTGLPLALDGR